MERKSLVRNSEVSALDYGKLPPQARELEEAVLGACLLEDSISVVSAILKPEHFYVSANELIYSSMIRLFAGSKPIDILTVTEELKKAGSLDSAGGSHYITLLTSKIGSTANVETHALIVKEAWMKRAVISTSTEAIKLAYEDTEDAFELLEKAGAGLDAIVSEVNSGQSRNFADVLNKQVNDIIAAATKPDEEKYVIGLPTGIYSLDRKTLGWTSPDMIVVAGRPGEGKTTLVIQSADKIMERGMPVGFVSAEMSLEQLNWKLLSMHSDIETDRLRSGRLTHEEREKVMDIKRRISKYRFYVYDQPCTPDTIRSLFKTWKKKYGIECGFVDYVQRLQVPGYLLKYNPESQISHASNAMKDIAMSLKIPMIVVSQMSRDIEKRTGEHSRPKLVDLRGSGTLEQDADKVVFVYRPEIHNIKTYSTGESTEGDTEFIVEKNRLGSLGTVRAKFIGVSNRFDDTDYSTYNQAYMPRDSDKQAELLPADDPVKERDDDLPF